MYLYKNAASKQNFNTDKKQRNFHIYPKPACTGIFSPVMSWEKICLTYFKICALYFEIGRTYFREGKNGAKIMRNKKAFFDMSFNISF